MTPKRAADQAFASDGVLVTAAGFDAPPPEVCSARSSPQRAQTRLTREQVHNYDNTSPSKLPIPGRWPGNDDSYLSDIEQEAPARLSVLSRLSDWALAQVVGFYRYIRPQQVIVQPIVRKDGARKKRIIEVEAAPTNEPAITKAAPTDEPADAPPTPTTVLRTKTKTRASEVPHLRLYKRGRGRGKEHNLWLPQDAPNPPSASAVAAAAAAAAEAAALESAPVLAPASPIAEAASTPSPSKAAYVEDAPKEDDDSIDFSFSDVVGSTTPPGCSTFNPHVIYLDSPAINFEASLVQEAQLPQVSQGPRPRSRSIEEISPNSHFRIIRKSSTTPVRKALLKRQAYSYVFETEARKNSFAEAQAPGSDIDTDIIDAPTAEEAYQAYYNHVETVDQDLEDLPDAPPLEDFVSDIVEDSSDFVSAIVEESDPNYRLKPRVRKTVQWSEFTRAKPFYYDAAACDMLDSTLEFIHSPAKPSYREGEHHDESDSDATDRPVGSPASSQGQDSPQQSAAVGFTGVPDATWDDSEESLSELQLSEELVSEFRETHLATAAAASPSPSPSPPPAPAVVIKDLVTPASWDELCRIEGLAEACDDGKITDYAIIEYKVHARDFSTLLPAQFSGDPRAWLNDAIVNEYLAIVTAEAKKKASYVKSSGSAPPVHTFSSFFYPTLKDGANGVARWAGKVNLGGTKYLDANLVLYPICHKGHWRLLAVKPRERTIEYLDSLGGDGDLFIDAIKGYLKAELKEAWVEEEWTVLDTQSSQQVNGSDCGVFTILNALALLQERELFDVKASDGMHDARERIAITLMNAKVTTEF